MVKKAKSIEAPPGEFLSLSAADAKPLSEPSSSGQSRVIYIGHLPHGFYEKALLGYFGQFGKLSKVRLSRNKKTGKAKHYAFLEFENQEVAAIAAEAMDGYFMFKQKIECHVMKPEDIHPDLFKGADRKFRNIPWRRIERKRHDKEMTPAELAKRVARAMSRDTKRQKKIASAGIDYEYTPLKMSLPAKSKKTVFSDAA